MKKKGGLSRVLVHRDRPSYVCGRRCVTGLRFARETTAIKNGHPKQWNNCLVCLAEATEQQLGLVCRLCQVAYLLALCGFILKRAPLKTFGGGKRIYTRRIFDLLWHRKRWSVRRRFVMWCLILCFRTSLWWKQYPAHWYTVSIILDKTFMRLLPETTLILKFNNFLLAREEKYI